MQEHAEELSLFGGEVNQTGFVAQLTSQLLELKVGCITPDELTEIAAQLAPEEVELTTKLREITIIATAFEAAMQKQFIENTTLIDALTDYLKKTRLTRLSFLYRRFRTIHGSRTSASRRLNAASKLNRSLNYRLC